MPTDSDWLGYAAAFENLRLICGPDTHKFEPTLASNRNREPRQWRFCGYRKQWPSAETGSLDEAQVARSLILLKKSEADVLEVSYYGIVIPFLNLATVCNIFIDT